MHPLQPFDLTQIEIDNLPEKWQDWHLENSSLARTWSETLDEAVLDNQIKPELAHKLLHALMPATVRAWAEHTWEIGEVQMQSGPVVSYNRNDDVYKFVLENVTLTLPPGEPNPMDGYQPPPPGRGRLNNPYDLTRDADEDEDEGGDDGVTTTNGALDALQLASSPPDPVPVTPTKRTHSTMTASRSTTAIAPYPSRLSPPHPSESAKPKGPQQLIITIPRLTIILYPSGFYKHHDSLPIKDRPTLRAAAKQFEKEKMEKLGLKKTVRRRSPRGPMRPKKKKPKTGEKVDRVDLDEDEGTVVGNAMQEKGVRRAPQQHKVGAGKNMGWLVAFMEGESD